VTCLPTKEPDMRVLVSVSPRMYCEAIAFSIHRNRPGLDVRVASPEDAERELASFRLHLLVHNDTAPIPEGVLDGVPYRVEVVYSDSMDACVIADSQVESIGDMDLEGLMRAVDGAAEVAGRKEAPD
jgi:hypothetical protein